MIRLDTTAASLVSDVWTPTGETVLQLDGGPSTTTVDVQCRVHADAPWQTITTLHAAASAVVRIAQLPSMRLSLQNNAAGQRVRVWDNA